MELSQSPNASSGAEPPPIAILDAGAPPVRAYAVDSVGAFVASAYEAHHSAVYGFLARSTRDPSVAEDFLQEAFLRLTREARCGRAPLQVRAWLFRVAANLVIGRSRRQTTASRWLGRYGRREHERMIASSPEAGVMLRERAAELDRVLAGLSADARLALLMAGDGFAGEEIAAAIGRSGAATRTLMCRARARVRVVAMGEDGTNLGVGQSN